MQKAIFLDRDGVLNVDRNDYTYRIEDFQIMEGAKEVLSILKQNNYKLIVVTNQAGISKGIYSEFDMNNCHEYLQSQVNNAIDNFYFAPDHPQFSESLSRKPDSLLFEKAISRYEIDVNASWMIGDQERDLIPARKVGLKTIYFSISESIYADFSITNLKGVLPIILEGTD